MGKRILSVLSLAVLLSSCGGKVTSDMETYGLVSRPREMSVLVSEGELDYTVFFNRRGQADSLVRYTPDGDVHDKEIYFYDRKHHRTMISSRDSDGNQEGWYEYEYDGDFISVCQFYGMNSNVIYRWEHLNDGKNIIETRCYLEGELQYTDCKDFDGLSYEERQLGPDGNLVGTAHVELFSKDKPSLIVQEDSEIRIDYNESALPVHSAGALLSSNGDLGWHPSLEESPDRWYKYEFDSKGNWVTRTTHASEDGEPLVTVRRTLVY